LLTWNRSITNETKQANEPIDNPRILFFVIGGISFFAGNLCNEILYFPSLNLLFSFLVMITITLVTYRVFTFDAAYHIYSYWRLFQEFRQWKKSKTAQVEIETLTKRSSVVERANAPIAMRSVGSPAKYESIEQITLAIPNTDVDVQQEETSKKPSPNANVSKGNLFPNYSDTDSDDTDDDDDDSGVEEEIIPPKVTSASSVEKSPTTMKRRSDVTDLQLFGDPNVNSDEEDVMTQLASRKVKSPEIRSASPVEDPLM
jgi:hypothetical protein